MNISEELDRSFGDGPPLPPVAVRIAAGRKGLARRRARNGVAGLAAAAALAGGYYVAAPGEASGSGLPAINPPPSVTPEPTQQPTEEQWQRGTLLRYVDGELQIRPGVEVHEHIENPYGFEPPGLSDALDVTWKGQRQWLMIERGPGSRAESTSASTPSNGWASFADYVADQVSSGASGSGWPQTFELDGGGQVVPTPGTRVHNRTDDPQLGPDFAPPGVATGAAVVTVAGEASSYFVVWRVVEGTLDVITTPPDEATGATFEELLAYARSQYASGEGLR
jgi:hypothetical protein